MANIYDLKAILYLIFYVVILLAYLLREVEV
jgi:hypothetical protein